MCLHGLASISFILKYFTVALSSMAPFAVAVDEGLCRLTCLSLEVGPDNREVDAGGLLNAVGTTA